ncbi:APC family permease [Paucibacter sp. R3-3]|uniref:APC family permease n=1 Tax=Roseateles agri TaxID=3098619 RepID=A0ABU5DHE5_9BURK|nr:APC family permease [Paucibacter sp. R3-3]MDY0745216.1 APC family permease [Paucibacter sp. R3-3]
MTTMNDGELRRVLRFSDLLIYGMTYMVPVAPWVIFGFLRELSHGRPALAYGLAMACMAFTAAGYALMAQRVPRAGSVYAYARESLGAFAGFLAGWLMLLDYILFPALTCVFAAIGLHSQIPQLPREVWVILLVALTLAINWFGIDVSARISAGFFWLSIAAVLVFVVAALRVLGDAQPPTPTAPIDWAAMLPATAFGVMSFLGFDGISTLAEEVRPEHRRLIGRAILASLALTGLLFVVQAALLDRLSDGVRPGDLASLAYEVANARLGPWLGGLMTWTVVLAAIVAMVPIGAGVARLLFAMGRDRQLPAVLGRIHPRHGTPFVAMLLTSAVALVVALVGVNHADELSSMINFGALGGFCLLHLSVLRYFRGAGHRALASIGLLISLALLSGLSAMALAIGLIWLALGLVWWFVALRGRALLDQPREPFSV